MKKYAYVVSEGKRSVTTFDFTDKTATDWISYDDGDFDMGAIYSWKQSTVVSGVTIDYVSIEELAKYFGEDDLIISSDLLLPEIFEKLGSTEYSYWSTYFGTCSKMLKAYSKLTETETLSLEDLIKAMQQ